MEDYISSHEKQNIYVYQLAVIIVGVDVLAKYTYSIQFTQVPTGFSSLLWYCFSILGYEVNHIVITVLGWPYR